MSAEAPERLRDASAPGEREAAVRAWAVVRCAAPAIQAPPRRRPQRRSALALGAAGAATVALVVTPAGAALARLVHDVVARPAPAHVASGLQRLPGGGRLLVNAGGAAWVVQPDGAKRRLGAYRDASFSPHGLFVAAVRAAELVALTPTGTVRWTLDRPAVAQPRWAPDGTYVAYRSGDALRLVWGNGTHDAAVDGVRPGPAAPAWQPLAPLAGQGPGTPAAPARVDPWLSYVTRDGTVALRHALTGKVAWARRPSGLSPRALVWAPGGGRLAVVGARRVALLAGGSGRTLTMLDSPPGDRPLAAAFSPDGRRLALLGYDAGRDSSDLVVAGRVLSAGAGRYGEVSWSPDGRWLLVSWPTVDAWLLVPADGSAVPREVTHVSRLFASRPSGQPPSSPRPADWCCR